MTSGEHTKGHTELRWQDAADQICETMQDRMKDHARVAAEVIYADVMTATQDYLRENVVFNLHSELSSLQFRLDKLHKEAAERESAVAELVKALEAHQLWEKREKEGPLYPWGMKRDDPGGEEIWRAWWNDQLRLCELSHELTDSALTRFREAQAGGDR